MNLSPHLTLEEMTRSQLASRSGIDNTPPDVALARMRLLAVEIFEPVRALLGVPLHIDSGFRCLSLNQAVHGASNSAHLTGDALDCVPVGVDLQEAFDKIRRSDIPFDQLIYECAAWLHIGQAREGQTPRRQVLVAIGTPGAWTYREVV